MSIECYNSFIIKAQGRHNDNAFSEGFEYN